MKRAIVASFVILVAGPGVGHGQAPGNRGYGSDSAKAAAVQRDMALRVVAKDALPPSPTSMFVEASVLMNVKADEHVAVFAISHEGETLPECSQKMDATVKAFAAELKRVGVADKDVAIDFISQNKIYGFQVQGDVLQEKLVGFELKKNVSIRYQESAQIEKVALAAARAQVFDLVKVDYIVKDSERVQDKLLEEGARIVKHKMARSERLLGVKLLPPAQVYAEKSATHYPTQLYDSYKAYESEEVGNLPRDQKYTVRRARKSTTFFFNGLDGDGFDAVINPVVTEPVVQYTLYLKVKYDIEQPKAK
jgi:uncharacterized protein YggE